MPWPGTSDEASVARRLRIPKTKACAVYLSCVFFFYLQIPPLDRRTVILIFAATTSTAIRACAIIGLFTQDQYSAEIPSLGDKFSVVENRYSAWIRSRFSLGFWSCISSYTTAIFYIGSNRDIYNNRELYAHRAVTFCLLVLIWAVVIT